MVGIAPGAPQVRAQVRPIGPVADDAEEITRAVLAASEDATLLVISGGASVGPHDLVKPALEAAGFTLDFWRIAIKPGKPFTYGRIDDIPFFGLPGNPSAVLVCYLASRRQLNPSYGVVVLLSITGYRIYP